MMAILWAQQIRLGRRTLDQTPAQLRARVEALLEGGTEVTGDD